MTETTRSIVIDNILARIGCSTTINRPLLMCMSLLQEQLDKALKDVRRTHDLLMTSSHFFYPLTLRHWPEAICAIVFYLPN